jgi:hypothetical protein
MRRLSQSRTIPMAQQQVYCPLQPQENPPSSPNSSHRILHTQSPYHHPSLCPANTHAAQQNDLSIASALGLAGGQIHLSKRPRERTSEGTSSARPKGVDSSGRMRSHSLHDDGLLRSRRRRRQRTSDACVLFSRALSRGLACRLRVDERVSVSHSLLWW